MIEELTTAIEQNLLFIIIIGVVGYLLRRAITQIDTKISKLFDLIDKVKDNTSDISTRVEILEMNKKTHADRLRSLEEWRVSKESESKDFWKIYGPVLTQQKSNE